MKRRRMWWWFVLLSCGAAALAFAWQQIRDAKFRTEIQTAASRYGVDPMLVKAVIWRESRFNPQIRGRKGELGLMQIQETAAREWASAEHVGSFQHEHCLDPATNVLAGTYYLSKLLKRYSQADDPIPYALADYNAGRGNVLKWNGGVAETQADVFIRQIGFGSTRRYVLSIQRRYAWYRWLARWGWS